MDWFYLFMAGFGEIVGVSSVNSYLMKRAWSGLGMCVVDYSLGFLFLALAMREIPLATAYAIWTGLGATGAVLMGVLFFKEKMSFIRVIFLTCIIFGAVGLKLVS